MTPNKRRQENWGASGEVLVVSSGVGDENLGTGVANYYYYYYSMEVPNSVVNGEITIPIVTKYLVEEGTR